MVAVNNILEPSFLFAASNLKATGKSALKAARERRQDIQAGVCLFDGISFLSPLISQSVCSKLKDTQKHLKDCRSFFVIPSFLSKMITLSERIWNVCIGSDKSSGTVFSEEKARLGRSILSTASSAGKVLILSHKSGGNFLHGAALKTVETSSSVLSLFSYLFTFGFHCKRWVELPVDALSKSSVGEGILERKRKRIVVSLASDVIHVFRTAVLLLGVSLHPLLSFALSAGSVYCTLYARFYKKNIQLFQGGLKTDVPRMLI